MKVSQLFCQTLREAPSDAVLPSHALLLRAGAIHQVAAGIYSLTPMGLRITRKIEAIIRREMNAVGGQEIDLPLVQPASLWQESGRYTAIQEELLRFSDRANHDMVLAMTHEEAVTDLVRSVLNSYRQLPFMLYQFKLKFRDEARPRAGLIRVREFVMKDAYSFHRNAKSLDEWYNKVHDAYLKIFRGAGIEPVVVKSDTGIMGGKEAHEFMLETPNGEDYLILCDHCGLQANAEIAEFDRGSFADESEEELALEKVATPNSESIEEVSEFLGVKKEQTMKAVFFENEERLVAVFVRGHLDVSEIKLRNLLGVSELIPASEETIRSAQMEPGFASPLNIQSSESIQLIADISLKGAKNLVAGANEKGFHFKGFSVDRDTSFAEFVDIAQAIEGSACPKCGKELRATRGIEIGNIFKLGTKFSESMNAVFLDEDGKNKPAIMGCYGIGVGRLMASVAEVKHDEWGPIWPKSIAPYQVEILSLGVGEEIQSAAQNLYETLLAQGIEVLFDDRDERAGVKFKDADLWGIPVRISVGKKSLAQNSVEWKIRGEKNFDLVEIQAVAEKLKEFYS